MVLFDSHCHLTDARFDGDGDGEDGIPAVLERARAAGVVGVVTIASDAADASAAAMLASLYEDVWCTAGIHPHAAASADDDAKARTGALVTGERAVAVGETGLDYHYDNAPRDVQRKLLDWHLALAERTGRPVVVHSREAEDDTAAAIRNATGVRGVLHCFTGSGSLLDRALEAGWYVSFAGLITFRNYGGAEQLRRVPDDRLLLETDSPYLAPVPRRGRRNEPAFVADTCAAAALLRGVDTNELGRLTTANALRFYGLDPEP
ncbi:MAG: TatD family hydrolase [Longimicrobiales bacterium]